jgi:hypothetical protein
MNAFFILINIVGLLLNMSLYYIDIYQNDGVLDKVDQGSSDDDKKEEALTQEGQVVQIKNKSD